MSISGFISFLMETISKGAKNCLMFREENKLLGLSMKRKQTKGFGIMLICEVYSFSFQNHPLLHRTITIEVYNVQTCVR